MFPYSKPGVKRKVSILGNDLGFHNDYFLTMEGSSRLDHVQRWYLKEWRRRRRLTQQALAEDMGTTKASISKLEAYQIHGPGPNRQKINDEWLGRYCRSLKVTQRELAELPETPTPIDDLIKDASPADQRRFRALAEAFIKPDR
jgi:transcriptional regulator with XRE-family HTH domain